MYPHGAGGSVRGVEFLQDKYRHLFEKIGHEPAVVFMNYTCTASSTAQFQKKLLPSKSLSTAQNLSQ